MSVGGSVRGQVRRGAFGGRGRALHLTPTNNIESLQLLTFFGNKAGFKTYIPTLLISNIEETIMSRKSARILSRKRKADDTEQEIIETFSKKRKADIEPEISIDVEKRRKRFQIQNQWIPISNGTSILSSSVVPTTSKSPPLLPVATCVRNPNNVTPKELVMPSKSTFRFQNHFTTPIHARESPLPRLQWADPQEVWDVMLLKEQRYTKSTSMLQQHPCLMPRMRSILLDWLIEVCEVYQLHRESFYLAIDFIDRYMCATQDIQKSQLQLLGITALFIAAKLEEIYPPKLTEFAYVTDGACAENEILGLELVILKTLNWDLCPMTPNSWLNVFLQLVNHNSKKGDANSFVFPQYSQHAFVQIARLLDLCLLDIECLQFKYSVLATAALYHVSSDQIALSVSGYEWYHIAPCVQWMAPFAMTLREAGAVELKFFNKVSSENTHHIQTHSVDLPLLEKAQARQSQMARSARTSPDLAPPGIITPPQSTKAKLSSPLAADLAPLAKKVKVPMQQEEQENTDPQVSTPPSSSPALPISPQS